MKLDDVLKNWENDAKIDHTEPGKELLRIPILHSKYLNILVVSKANSKKISIEISKLKKLKWKYYTGKMDEKELDEKGWEPFNFVLKNDVPVYMDADDDLLKLVEKKAYYDEIVSVCESILGELKQRTWQLKEYIGFEKFINGQ